MSNIIIQPLTSSSLTISFFHQAKKVKSAFEQMMGRRSSDFKFWEEKLPVVRRSSSVDEGELFELQRHVEDQVGACSPPLWGTARHLSPTSRIRAILDARRELMERIRDMPESSYELSLKDLVDQQSEEGVQVVVAEEKIVRHKRENRLPRRAKSTKERQLCRSESMESDVFLLKMFVPVSLSSKKKARPRKHPRSEAAGEPEKQVSREWWKSMCLSMRENQKITSIMRTSSLNSLTSEKKQKSRGRRGCLF